MVRIDYRSDSTSSRFGFGWLRQCDQWNRLVLPIIVQIEWNANRGCPWSRRCAGSPPQAVTTKKVEYSRLTYSKCWSNAARFKLAFLPSFFSVSSNGARRRMLCRLRRSRKPNAAQAATTADSRLKNLCSDTKCWKQRRLWRKIKQAFDACRVPAYDSFCKTAHRVRERERERKAQKTLLLQVKKNNTTNLTKRLLGHYI